MTDHLLMALGPTLLGVFARAYPDLALQPHHPFQPRRNHQSQKRRRARWNSGQRLVWWRVLPTDDHVHHERSTRYFNLDVPGDDPRTPSVKESYTLNETVSFKIGDLAASQTAP